MLFLLMTASFNETLLATHPSGYGRSSSVLYFIHVDSEQNFKDASWLRLEFQDFPRSVLSSGLNLTSADPTFHAGLLFFNIHSEYGLSYCYFCSEEVGKFHKIYWRKGTLVWCIFSIGKSRDVTLNQHTGYKQLQVILFVVLKCDAVVDLSSLFSFASSR